MTANETLCWIMWAKQYKLEELGIKIKYFTLKDQETILYWPIEVAENVLQELFKYADLIADDTTCPYCILRDLSYISDCFACPYASIHGGCSNKTSTYYKLCRIAEKMYGEDAYVRTILTEPYMKWMLKEAKKFYNSKDSWGYIR